MTRNRGREGARVELKSIGIDLGEMRRRAEHEQDEKETGWRQQKGERRDEETEGDPRISSPTSAAERKDDARAWAAAGADPVEQWRKEQEQEEWQERKEERATSLVHVPVDTFEGEGGEGGKPMSAKEELSISTCACRHSFPNGRDVILQNDASPFYMFCADRGVNTLV